MKVFTNENNPQTLKIIVSANVSRHDILCETVTTADARFQSPRKLPVLLLDSGSKLFSCNASSLYLFPPSAAAEKQVEQWLDWEAVKLQPLLVHVGSKTDPSSNILALFNELEKALDKTNHLVQGELSVADVCISSSLYPLFVDVKLKSQYFAKLPNLSRWLTALFAQKEFKDAVEKLKLKKESLLPCVTTSCWYPTSLGKASATPAASSTQDEGQEKRVLTEEEIAAAILEWNNGADHRLKLSSPVAPVLPRAGEDNVLITSALPYVNNVPHLGNIIGCVLSADVFARYCRSRGWNTLYIAGTDEYGTATEMKALEEGSSPQQICDKYFAIHRDIYDWFNIEFDKFGRTSTPAQTEIVQDLFHQVHQNGYTFIESVDQLLCEKCNRFLADRFVEGICPNCKYEDARGDQCDGCGHLINAVELIQPRCKQCQSTPVVRQSNQLFLDLPKIQAKVEDWAFNTYDEWSNIAKVITKAWLKEGLKPRCITRDLKWGVPVPLEGFENKVFYVWFDACIGYMSITKTYTDKWLEWWQPKSTKVTLYQFMAKDNVPFHSIIFPSLLHACDRGYTILRHLFATEYLNYENGKFSKSRGIGVFGNDAKETGIPSDIFRFYLLYLRPESQDSNFSWADLATKNNTELLNNLGNFILRSLSFTEKFFDSKIPPITLSDEEKELVALAAVELKSYILVMNKGRLREGVKYILNISRHGNGYMQSTQPWVLVKGTDEQKKKASSAIGLLCNVVALVASLLRPYMPQTVETIAKQLNLDVNSLSIMETFQPYLKTGHQIGKPLPLFTKIEPAVVELLKQKYAGRQKSGSPEAPPTSGKLNLEGIDHLTALATIENAVTKQGELVRTMKAAGKSKEELKPHIATLLDLKKQLAEFQATNSVHPPTSSAHKDQSRLKDLEAQIAAQGELVRTMKAAGKSKEELKPHIATLLDFKKQLADFQATNSVRPPTSSDNGELDLKDLEAQIAAQGDKVRVMKAAGKSKEELKPEIDMLLELKKKLPAQPEGNKAAQKNESGSKNKKKNKKK